MRMHLEGVKNPQITPIRICVICGWLSDLPPAAPTSVVPIAVAMTASPFPSIIITVAVAAIASEDVAETGISIRSATVPTTIARVVAVNKLLALLIKAATSASAATLAHSISRHADENNETQNQNPK